MKYLNSKPFSLFCNLIKKTNTLYIFFFSHSCSFSSNNLNILVSIQDFSSSLARSKAASLACMIIKFQQDTGYTRYFQIDPDLWAFIDSFVPCLLLEPVLSKRCTRTSREPSSSYKSFWLTDIDKFPATVFCFEEIPTNSPVMDFSLQQSITNAVSSAMATAIAAIQTKHKSKMFALRKRIKKSLLLTNSTSATLIPNSDTALKTFLDSDFLPKTCTKR